MIIWHVLTDATEYAYAPRLHRHETSQSSAKARLGASMARRDQVGTIGSRRSGSGKPTTCSVLSRPTSDGGGVEGKPPTGFGHDRYARLTIPSCQHHPSSADASVFEEPEKAGRRVSMNDRLGDGVVPGELGAFRARPPSSAATSGALLERRAASRSSEVAPLISRSMSNRASMRLTASSAIGEIGAAFLYQRLCWLTYWAFSESGDADSRWRGGFAPCHQR